MQNQNNIDEKFSRRMGKEAQKSNFEAIKTISEIVETTLGPKGMDKMLIDDFGEITITNDGVKILKEMQIEHPAAKMLVEVAKTQEKEVGDGTTTAVIYTGHLIEEASKLIQSKIHPSLIIKYYQECLEEILKFLKNSAQQIQTQDFQKVAQVSITGKVAEKHKEMLSEIVVNSLNLVKEKNEIPLNRIKIQKISGGSIEESQIIKGLVLDKELANINMPTQKQDAKILLIETPLELSDLSNEFKYEINTPDQYEMFIQKEENFLKDIVEKIKQINCDVIFCQKGIDDKIAYYLAQNNIMAVRRCKRSDMEKLSYALGTNIISSLEDIKSQNLGYSKNVQQKKIQNQNYIFIEDAKNPKAITILLKSSTIHVLDEVERAIDDALGNIEVLIRNPYVVSGGGAIEFEIYKHLYEKSQNLEGQEQIIIKSFAEAVLSIPKILCSNCGFYTLETITQGIAKHNQNFKNAGIDCERGLIDNVLENFVFEPLEVKNQAFKSAVEVACMILRIDDIIASKPKQKNIDTF